MSDPQTAPAAEPHSEQAKDNQENASSLEVATTTTTESESSTAVVPKKKKRRPARVQKEPGTVQDQLPQSGTVFNIWYLKWYVF